MPPDGAPTNRIDREWLNSVELDATESLLYGIYDLVDALTITRAVYPQVLLSPEEAARKKQLQEQQMGG